LVLDRAGRDDFARDMVSRALQESAEPLELDQVVTRVNELAAMTLAKGTVQRLLKDLVDSGYVEITSRQTRCYARTPRVYTEMDQNTSGLRTMLGPKLHAYLEEAGLRGFNDIVAQPSTFRPLFSQITGLGQSSAALFVDLAATMLEDRAGQASSWSFTDLIGSPYPRPYQYEAYAVFRGYGYAGQLVEAPTGSGKTMIGMMCIQDWLNDLRPGQSSWCSFPPAITCSSGLASCAANPSGCDCRPRWSLRNTQPVGAFPKAHRRPPGDLLMTYTALSQAGSAVGKGGLTSTRLRCSCRANVQHIILDEVHKVAEN
jgi:hypothetical protein